MLEIFLRLPLLVLEIKFIQYVFFRYEIGSFTSSDKRENDLT